MSQQRKHEVTAPIAGTIWKITTTVGSVVGEEDVVLIMESMKMEMPVEAEDEGVIDEILVKEGQPVTEGAPLVSLK